MSESPLSKHAGPIAVVAGGLFAVVHAGMSMIGDRSDLVAMMKDPLFLVFNYAFAITFPLLMIALVAVYWRQAGEAGVFGAIAFCVATAGTVALAGDMWFEGYAVPWLADVAPATFDVDRSGSGLEVAWLVTMVLFSAGWALFGVAMLRARVVPPVLSIAVVIGGLVGFLAAMPPWGAVLGVALAAVGAWLIRHDRQVTSSRGGTSSAAGRDGAPR